MFLNSLRISYIDALVLIIFIPCSFLCLLPESSPPPSWLSFFSFCCCFPFPTHWVCFGWPETPQTGGYRLWGQPTRSHIVKGKPISWRSHELHMMASQLGVWFVSATVLSVQKMFGCSLSQGLLSVILPSLSLAWSLSPGGNVIKSCPICGCEPPGNLFSLYPRASALTAIYCTHKDNWCGLICTLIYA